MYRKGGLVMKKLFITSVLFGLMISSQAQLTYFFPDSNSYFSVSWMKFWFHGDTTIGSFTYKKVYVQSGDSIADFNNSEYFAAIREDTNAKKVYCIIPYDSTPMERNKKNHSTSNFFLTEKTGLRF